MGLPMQLPPSVPIHLLFQFPLPIDILPCLLLLVMFILLWGLLLTVPSKASASLRFSSRPVHVYVGCVLAGRAIPELDRRHKNVRQSTVNALALQPSAHDYWDRASFALQRVSSTMKKGNEASFLLAQAWFFALARFSGWAAKFGK